MRSHAWVSRRLRVEDTCIIGVKPQPSLGLTCLPVKGEIIQVAGECIGAQLLDLDVPIVIFNTNFMNGCPTTPVWMLEATASSAPTLLTTR